MNRQFPRSPGLRLICMWGCHFRIAGSTLASPCARRRYSGNVGPSLRNKKRVSRVKCRWSRSNKCVPSSAVLLHNPLCRGTPENRLMIAFLHHQPMLPYCIFQPGNRIGITKCQSFFFFLHPSLWGVTGSLRCSNSCASVEEQDPYKRYGTRQ